MSHTSINTVIEEFPTMVFAISNMGEIQFWNNSSEEVTGFTAQEVSKEADFLNSFFVDTEFLRTINRIQKEGKDTSIAIPDIKITSRDNTSKTIRFIVRYRQNPIIEGLNTWVIGFDETEISELNKAVDLSRARFELISQATNDAIWEWDIQKDTLWWGEGIKELFGHPEGGQYTSFQWWSDKVHQDDRDRVVQKLRDSATKCKQAWSDEYQFKRKDGTYSIVQDKGISICDINGKAIRMIGGMSDITEKKIYEKSLIIKNQQLAEYAFFNSHKVRAPLARLLSCVDLLQIEANLDEDTIGILKAIKLSADELDNEIRDIGNILSLDSNLGTPTS